MSKMFLSLLLVVSGVFSAVAQESAVDSSNLPRFKFAGGDVHDFGSIKEGETAVYTFEFRNAGKSPLIIKNVLAADGGAMAEWGGTDANGQQQPMMVAPGKTGRIKVSFLTRSRSGPFHKSFWIESNAIPSPAQSRYEINIKGTIVAEASLTPTN